MGTFETYEEFKKLVPILRAKKFKSFFWINAKYDEKSKVLKWLKNNSTMTRVKAKDTSTSWIQTETPATDLSKCMYGRAQRNPIDTKWYFLECTSKEKEYLCEKNMD